MRRAEKVEILNLRFYELTVGADEVSAREADSNGAVDDVELVEVVVVAGGGVEAGFVV